MKKKKKKPLADLPTLLSKRESHKGSGIKRVSRWAQPHPLLQESLTAEEDMLHPGPSHLPPSLQVSAFSWVRGRRGGFLNL